MDPIEREFVQVRLRRMRADRAIDRLRSLGKGPREIIRARVSDAIGAYCLAEMRAGRPLSRSGKVRYGGAQGAAPVSP